MGEWHQTCTFTGLPVVGDEPVVMFIQKIPDSVVSFIPDGYYDQFSYYKPMCLPVVGKYNGYGDIENVDRNHPTAILAELLFPSIWKTTRRSAFRDTTIMWSLALKGAYDVLVEIGESLHKSSASPFAFWEIPVLDNCSSIDIVKNEYGKKVPKKVYGSSDVVSKELFDSLQPALHEWECLRYALRMIRRTLLPTYFTGSQALSFSAHEQLCRFTMNYITEQKKEYR